MRSNKITLTWSVVGLASLLVVTFAFQNCARIKYAGDDQGSGAAGLAAPVDTDSDGLSDDEDTLGGTLPNNPDTDGDGLPDGAEVNTYRTDPLDPDTDNGGVNDGAEVANGKDPLIPADDSAGTDGAVDPDPDDDGLTNTEEEAINTDPDDEDSDNDGLSDGDEVNSTHTIPVDSDTDDGGVNDGDEIENGTNPLDPSDDVVGNDIKNSCARFKGRKTLICHIPPGNPQNSHNICVGTPAVKQHIKLHKDYEGPCR